MSSQIGMDPGFEPVYQVEAQSHKDFENSRKHRSSSHVVSINLLTCLTALPFLPLYCEKVNGSYLSEYGLLSNNIGYGGLLK